MSGIDTNDKLFNKIVSIIEGARANVVRSVNINMVVAYWLIGKEISHLSGDQSIPNFKHKSVEHRNKKDLLRIIRQRGLHNKF